MVLFKLLVAVLSTEHLYFLFKHSILPERTQVVYVILLLNHVRLANVPIKCERWLVSLAMPRIITIYVLCK